VCVLSLVLAIQRFPSTTLETSFVSLSLSGSPFVEMTRCYSVLRPTKISRIMIVGDGLSFRWNIQLQIMALRGDVRRTHVIISGSRASVSYHRVP